MKRRHFVGSALAGAALWPLWLREAFGEGAACEAPLAGQGPQPSVTRRAGAVGEAFRKANHSGRRLLVIVIPADDDKKRDRGDVWGELLNFGTDVQLAPLSSVEAVCATMADLKTVVPNVEVGEPLFLVVSTDKVPATVRAFDTSLPEHADFFRGDENLSWEELERQDDVTSTQRIAAMASLLRGALGAPGVNAAEDAANVRLRLKDRAPSGTHWAVSSGCGTRVEGVTDNVAFGCGMGHVPAKSRRFLYFFSRT
jgi:hypothetical protein